jgi:N-acetyltransferase
LVIINKELGAAEQKLTDLDECHAFLHISPKSRKVDGCLIAAPIEYGYRVVPEAGDTFDPQDSNVAFDETNQISVVGGISRIWVSLKSRKQGIAKKLLDLLRLEMLFGVELSKNQIAFSQPTNMGQRLARSYFSRPDYLIYIED